ncbi:similar to serine/threonine-protein kinase bur1 [Plenodomus lingam JN3]|uniref:Serine/threonine-protein kinase BUR1 n=1 Tax=Leptosphaeria maculans (strain JN3 / isolate v23.1.3 / race Av1-4-5-6-7-8) TaxID=985895 RepID=E5ABU8_LEPMJ|nr:similar to serine/threonine-protein kinase bur1 [Plenodomus lingam JN3]CBY01139.1 similar to serine/threonine-protein kinase bur1 [Plenodomus lingam JN3]
MANPAADGAARGLQRRFKGCCKIGEYEMMQKLGEGTFGEVHKARHRITGSIFAMKKILMHNEKDGFPITALREIKLLKMLSHDNVLKLEEMAVERPKAEGRKRAILYMVTPYMDHDLSGLLDNPDVRFQEAQIKCYMLQLFKGLRYLHDNHILHRDMKAANLLINNRGRLQIADFGLARHYDEPVPQRGRGNGEAKREYTSLVVTRWYRPPELLLQLRRYTPAIDMWGAGCVFGEMFKRKPILAGQSDIHQAQIIFELVGSPNDETMPGWDQLPGAESIRAFPQSSGTLAARFRELSPVGLSLLKDLMRLDWRKRINAMDAIDHPYFKEQPLPMREEDIPHFADSHELDRRNARGQKQALPPAPQGGTVGGGPNDMALKTEARQGAERGPRGYDRRPVPYDHRPPPPPPGERRPNWGNGTDTRHSNLPGPPPDGRHPLPPVPRYGPGDDRRRPPVAGGDTYIPSYGGEGPRRSREPDDRQRHGSRDSGNSREGYTDDRPERSRAYRDRERDRERVGEGRNFGKERRDGRTRSRSPERRDRNRDNNDIYRRR